MVYTNLNFKKILGLCIWILVQFFALNSYSKTFGGFISIKDKQSFLVLGESSQTFALKALNQTTQQNLSKLSDGDFLIGQGDIINTDIVLSSVDFVGLKQLLGVWITKQLYSWIEFKDFTRVTTFLPKSFGSKGAMRLHYSVSPGEANSWKIYFSNEDSVVLATLKLNIDSAELKFFNVEDGSVTDTIQLQKISGQ